MTKADPRLQELLARADDRLAHEPLQLTGQSVRQFAARRNQTRQNRVAVVAIVGTLAAVAFAVWNRFDAMVTTKVANNQAIEIVDPQTENDALIADLRAIRQQRQLWQQQTELSALEKRLVSLDRKLRDFRAFSTSVDRIAQENTAAYSMLYAVTDSTNVAATDDNRSRLEKLIEFYPNTDAAAEANRLLARN